MRPVSLALPSLFTRTGQHLWARFMSKGNHLFAAQGVHESIGIEPLCVTILGAHVYILGYFGASKMECSGGQTNIVTSG